MHTLYLHQLFSSLLNAVIPKCVWCDPCPSVSMPFFPCVLMRFSKIFRISPYNSHTHARQCTLHCVMLANEHFSIVCFLSSSAAFVQTEKRRKMGQHCLHPVLSALFDLADSNIQSVVGWVLYPCCWQFMVCLKCCSLLFSFSLLSPPGIKLFNLLHVISLLCASVHPSFVGLDFHSFLICRKSWPKQEAKRISRLTISLPSKLAYIFRGVCERKSRGLLGSSLSFPFYVYKKERQCTIGGVGEAHSAIHWYLGKVLAESELALGQWDQCHHIGPALLGGPAPAQ